MKNESTKKSNTRKMMESGFKKGGHVIDITCEDRRLVINLAEEQRFENL